MSTPPTPPDPSPASSPTPGPDPGDRPPPEPAPAGPVHHPTRVPVWALALVATLVCWLVGYVPWLLSSTEQRDVRALTGTSVLGHVGAPWDWPLLLYPLSTQLLGGLLGGCLAGLSGLLVRRPAGRRRWPIVLATLGGALVAVSVPLGRALHALGTSAGGPLDDPAAEALLLTGFAGVVAVATVAGWAVGSAALAGRVGLGAALALLAGVVPGWLSHLRSAATWPTTSAAPSSVTDELLGPLLLAVAIVAVGATPWSRLAWWPVPVLLAWLTGPAETATAYLEPLLRPGYGLPGALPDALASTMGIFRTAALPQHRELLWGWVVAILLGAVVAVLRARRVRRGASGA